MELGRRSTVFNRVALVAVGLLGWLALAGCQSAPANGARLERPKLDKRHSVEITPSDEEFAGQRVAADSRSKGRRRDAAELTEGELQELPKFTVIQKGFRKLGLSVVTNTEVALGGTIEWMRVGVVLPASPAARAGLFTGIEIMAINNVPVAELSREEMLHQLFERESGEQVRLLVYSRQFGPLPRFVAL